MGWCEWVGVNGLEFTNNHGKRKISEDRNVLPQGCSKWIIWNLVLWYDWAIV